jgi:hypothetical protein
MTEARARIARRLRRQSDACARLGSSLYAGLLEHAAADAEAGGPVWEVLQGHDMDAAGSALALRFMGAVHRLALAGRAPRLAALYPSAGGRPGGPDETWQAFAAVLEPLAEDVQGLLSEPVQTNEVGRCAALAGGFLVMAREFGLPLRMLEIGASAGLNLRWDHYRYEARGATWGPADSPVRLCDFDGPPVPPFDQSAEVAERAGCDPRPLDPASAGDRLTLLSYVWPDQLHRIRLLRAALAVAERVPVPIATATADEWLAERLPDTTPGAATVVFHSIVMQYLSDDVRAKVDELIESAGRAATRVAPLARISMEPGGEEADVHLQMWPGGNRRLIARAGYHGSPTRWLP